MDFETLFEIVPKTPLQWKTEEVIAWLNHINLPSLAPAFQGAGVDGSCIHLLNEHILQHELGVASKIVRKKLMNWVSRGLGGYQDFLCQHSKMVSEQQELPEEDMTSHIRDRISLMNNRTNNYIDLETQKNQRQYMLIESYEGNNLGAHILHQNETVSIGKDCANVIQNIECSVGAHHATIKNSQNRYWLKDLGTQFGTYLQVTQRVELEERMILEIGSFQFKVMEMNNLLETLKLECIFGNLHEPPKAPTNTHKSQSLLQVQQQNINNSKSRDVLIIDFSHTSKFTFGRRKDNSFQRDDRHMSGIHCKLSFSNNKFYVEDMVSTNGTWIRIAQPFMKSEEIPIAHGTIIKIGTIATYICKVVDEMQVCQPRISEFIMDEQEVCMKCRREENNCLFTPCNHNLVCVSCSSAYDACPQCNQFINNRIRIIK